MAGIRPPRKGQKRPLFTVVFLCPVKTNTGLIRILSFMVGCIEQPLKRLAVSFVGRSNLIQSTAQQFVPVSGGLNFYKGAKPMLNHNQKPLTFYVSHTQAKKSLKSSRFNVFTKTRLMVAESVVFNEAIKYHPDCIIKFAGMEVMK